MKYDELSLKLEGLDLDKINDNFLIQVAGEALESAVNNEQLTVKEAVERAKEIERITAKIKVFENKLKKEKQFNEQVKFNNEIRKLKKLLETL